MTRIRATLAVQNQPTPTIPVFVLQFEGPTFRRHPVTGMTEAVDGGHALTVDAQGDLEWADLWRVRLVDAPALPPTLDSLTQ